ncbi:corneodesmosin-like [Cyclospora cayetanensis]|uniref:Corneodesmosin-like n=1 Tax=Cyclospora cayetanensis TaxID=88456 RepID=A0A6P6RU11_9EIME|nr:corneodesmosin-like [Cyclospora cayetanensis]
MGFSLRWIRNTALVGIAILSGFRETPWGAVGETVALEDASLLLANPTGEGAAAGGAPSPTDNSAVASTSDAVSSGSESEKDASSVGGPPEGGGAKAKSKGSGRRSGKGWLKKLKSPFPFKKGRRGSTKQTSTGVESADEGHSSEDDASSVGDASETGDTGATSGSSGKQKRRSLMKGLKSPFPWFKKGEKGPTKQASIEVESGDEGDSSEDEASSSSVGTAAKSGPKSRSKKMSSSRKMRFPFGKKKPKSGGESASGEVPMSELPSTSAPASASTDGDSAAESPSRNDDADTKATYAL